MLENSMIAIIGLPGAGKTSLETALGLNYMFGNACRERLDKCQRFVSKLETNGFGQIDIPRDHMVYADFHIEAVTPRFGTRVSYVLNPYDLRLPESAEDECCFPPPSSVLLIDEAQTIFNSREFSTLRPGVSLFYEKHRKMDYKIFFTCQRLGSVDIKIRELCGVILVEDQVVKEQYGRVNSVTWRYREWESCMDFEAGKEGHKDSFTVDFNIFDCYDSFEGKELFLQGLKNKGFSMSKSCRSALSPDGVKEYAARHPQIAPEGFRKQFSKGGKK